MGPIDAFWLAIVFVFVFIALVRGYLKELGLTLVMLVYLFALDQILPRILSEGSFVERALPNPETRDLVLWLTFTVLCLVTVFIAYAGETLAFEGTPIKGVVGVVLNVIVGFVNGYLVAGTLWWLMDFFNYPIQQFGLLQAYSPDQLLPPNSELIVNQLHLLPPDLLAGGVGDTALGLLPFLLITMVLLRVVR